jgi:hypothetical protein
LGEDGILKYEEEGQLTCKLKGTYIGPYNVEFFISGYGPSQTSKGNVWADSQGQPFVYHTMPTIDAIDQSSGGTNGGQFLTITGTGYDAAEGETEVL